MHRSVIILRNLLVVMLGWGRCIFKCHYSTFYTIFLCMKSLYLFFRYFPNRLEQFSELVEKNQSRLPYFLLSLRFLPISPNWAINMCCGLLKVPIVPFFFTCLIGLIPYNYICVTTGVLVSKLTSIEEIFTWTSFFQLSGVALMAFLPTFMIKQSVWFV